MPFNSNQEAYRGLRGVVTERTSRLIVWCGAGLSMPAGLPSWSELRRSLESTLREKALTFAETERVKVLDAVQRIERYHNHWVAFQLLQKELGLTSFRASVRQALLASATTATPRLYKDLWRLRVAGVLNLNLDRLATRAYTEVYPGRNIIEFNSLSVGSYTHVLKSPDPFIYNLHGVTDDVTSWVFSQDDLKQLLENERYLNFVRSLLSTSTVLFLGLSADDISVGGHLDRLTGAGIDTGVHYWITDRRDRATEEWAEAASIEVIRYQNQQSDHSELHEIFRDLLTYVPPDDTTVARPVVLEAELPKRQLPPPDELERQDAESIRMILNRHAAEILADESDEALQKYQQFWEEYDEAIHRAWFTSTSPGRNALLGFRLVAAIAEGAFGRVFRAHSPQGETVAIKVLRNDLQRHPQLLQSFRRGVRSMRILSRHGVEGMVAYREASEIPAFVVMDWIEGANLRDAVLAKRLTEWQAILRAAVQLASILRRAHALPERVLHRDLRPANIMLEELWTRDDDWNVVVLDFDLSWHRGAYGDTIIHGAGGTTGYLAPEQIEKIKGVSTRHASVDSFGLGMSLFFMLSGKDPVADQHRHGNWIDTVTNFAKDRECAEWHSLPARFARIIISATKDRQAERWDMSQILGELQRLLETIGAPGSVFAADVLAEEIAARAESFEDYVWDPNRSAARKQIPTGLALELRGVESSRRIELLISRTTTGVEDWKRISRWVPQASENCSAILKAGGWQLSTSHADRNTLKIEATVSVESAHTSISSLSNTLDKAARALHFE